MKYKCIVPIYLFIFFSSVEFIQQSVFVITLGTVVSVRVFGNIIHFHNAIQASDNVNTILSRLRILFSCPESKNWSDIIHFLKIIFKTVSVINTLNTIWKFGNSFYVAIVIKILFLEFWSLLNRVASYYSLLPRTVWFTGNIYKQIVGISRGGGAIHVQSPKIDPNFQIVFKVLMTLTVLKIILRKCIISYRDTTFFTSQIISSSPFWALISEFTCLIFFLNHVLLWV